MLKGENTARDMGAAPELLRKNTGPQVSNRDTAPVREKPEIKLGQVIELPDARVVVLRLGREPGQGHLVRMDIGNIVTLAEIPRAAAEKMLEKAARFMGANDSYNATRKALDATGEMSPDVKARLDKDRDADIEVATRSKDVNAALMEQLRLRAEAARTFLAEDLIKLTEAFIGRDRTDANKFLKGREQQIINEAVARFAVATEAKPFEQVVKDVLMDEFDLFADALRKEKTPSKEVGRAARLANLETRMANGKSELDRIEDAIAKRPGDAALEERANAVEDRLKALSLEFATLFREENPKVDPRVVRTVVEEMSGMGDILGPEFAGVSSPEEAVARATEIEKGLQDIPDAAKPLAQQKAKSLRSVAALAGSSLWKTLTTDIQFPNVRDTVRLGIDQLLVKAKGVDLSSWKQGLETAAKLGKGWLAEGKMALGSVAESAGSFLKGLLIKEQQGAAAQQETVQTPEAKPLTEVEKALLSSAKTEIEAKKALAALELQMELKQEQVNTAKRLQLEDLSDVPEATTLDAILAEQAKQPAPQPQAKESAPVAAQESAPVHHQEVAHVAEVSMVETGKGMPSRTEFEALKARLSRSTDAADHSILDFSFDEWDRVPPKTRGFFGKLFRRPKTDHEDMMGRWQKAQEVAGILGQELTPEQIAAGKKAYEGRTTRRTRFTGWAQEVEKNLGSVEQTVEKPDKTNFQNQMEALNKVMALLDPKKDSEQIKNLKANLEELQLNQDRYDEVSFTFRRSLGAENDPNALGVMRENYGVWLDSLGPGRNDAIKELEALGVKKFDDLVLAASDPKKLSEVWNGYVKLRTKYHVGGTVSSLAGANRPKGPSPEDIGRGGMITGV